MANQIMRSCVEAPKFAYVPTFLKNTAWQLGLKIEIEVDKGWLRETIRFKVEGDENKLKTFKINLEKAIQEYQRN